MNKDDKIKQLQYENSQLKQYLQLLNGPDAVERICKKIMQQQTDKALEIADANEFDNYIKEIAVYR